MTILSVNEAAKLLNKSPAALRNSYAKWGVPHFRLGGQIKFTQETLTEWIENGIKETTQKDKENASKSV